MSGGTQHGNKGVAATTEDILVQMDEQHEHLVTIHNTISASLAADQVTIHEDIEHLRSDHEELAEEVVDLSQRVAKLEQKIDAGEKGA